MLQKDLSFLNMLLVVVNSEPLTNSCMDVVTTIIGFQSLIDVFIGMFCAVKECRILPLRI